MGHVSVHMKDHLQLLRIDNLAHVFSIASVLYTAMDMKYELGNRALAGRQEG